MPLRRNRFLKFFFTLLFLFEFLSPVYPSDSNQIHAKPDIHSQVNSWQHPDLFFTFFAEQLNENEEERENDKIFSLLIYGHINRVTFNLPHPGNQFPYTSKPSHIEGTSRINLYCVFKL